MNNGWIKLHRKMLEWEWWDDPNTFRLFMYLLLSANHKDKKWRGIEIKRGQVLTGLYSLASGTGLSVQQVRTALDKLISTSEITSKSTNKYRIVTINKWENYQSLTNNPTSKQQTNNKQVTTTKNEKKENKQKKGCSLYYKECEPFYTFYQKYPNKKAPRVAHKSWHKATDKPNLEELLKILEQHKKTDQWQRDIIPNPATWLNQGRWEDELETKNKSNFFKP